MWQPMIAGPPTTNLTAPRCFLTEGIVTLSSASGTYQQRAVRPVTCTEYMPRLMATGTPPEPLPRFLQTQDNWSMSRASFTGTQTRSTSQPTTGRAGNYTRLRLGGPPRVLSCHLQ